MMNPEKEHEDSPEISEQFDEKAKEEKPKTEKDFDLSALRLGQNFAAEIGGKKLLTRVPVGKPDRHWFVRVRAEEEYRMPAAVIELRDEREVYVVHQSLVPELAGDVRACMLYTGISRQGVLFLWPVTLPGPDGRHNHWHASAMTAAELAMKKWIRMTADMNLGAYAIFEATGNLPDPEWPEMSFQKIVHIAFQGNIIDDINHPVLRRLRGEI